MGKRILVAVVCIPLIFVILYALPPVFVPIAISALSMIALHEVLWSTGFVQNPKISGASIALAGLIPFWVFRKETMFPALCGLLAYLTFIFIVAISSKHTVTLEKMGGAFFFAMLIPYFFSSFLRIKVMPLGDFLVLLPFVTAFCSDAFALFAGMLFGRHKLAPDLSPHKTVEGAVGGLLGAVGSTCLYGVIVRYAFSIQANFWLLALYGAFGSLMSQLGDLAFSYIKRQYHIKDFGNIFPGHGGVLDRFDSVLFCAPFIEVLLIVAPALSR